MKKIIAALCCIAVIGQSKAQQFIDKANIEFEVKTNVKKTMGNGMWGEMMKDNLQYTFKTAYYNFSFADNKSIYKFNRFDDAKIPQWLKEDETNEWYFDFSKDLFQMKKSLVGSPFVVKDSIPKIEWRLSNENRIIAGFNCRKATGVINDSIYIFAFYTDEIMISGGPCSVNGLPGMILGMTCPRLYTSWIATKVSVIGIDEAAIKPAASKKFYLRKEFSNFLVERSKDWSDGGEDKTFAEQFIWSSLL